VCFNTLAISAAGFNHRPSAIGSQQIKEYEMSEKVRIERLSPMRVAYTVAISTSPESDSFDRLLTWAKGRGLLKDTSYRLFGFDNPCPSPSEPEYGYETWITVGPEVEGEGQVRIKDFAGGLYAVTRIKGIKNIGAGWQWLIEWRKNSRYQIGSPPCLEQALSPMGTPPDEIVMDLYQPLAE
jgi:DNA gyrase inhibitor GyrI